MKKKGKEKNLHGDRKGSGNNLELLGELLDELPLVLLNVVIFVGLLSLINLRQ